MTHTGMRSPWKRLFEGDGDRRFLGRVKLIIRFFLVLVLMAGVSAQEFDPKSVEPENVPTGLFVTEGDFEVTLWASSPHLFNPTNIDIDKDGRIWVAEGVRYRRHYDRQPEGDRIMVLEDTDGDGQADSSHVFVQEEALIAPLGVAVIDNKIVVSQPPELIVYTDVNRDLKFDPSKDKREVLLTGFQGKNHDHSLHSVTVGPDGKWYWNSGNCGAQFTDKDNKTWTIFGPYRPKPIGPFQFPHNADELAGKPSADGHIYVGGFSVRMNPDATGVEIIGHNYRNSYEQSVTSFGDVFQNDNDDPPACRVSYVMEYANFGFSSNNGQRSWRSDIRPGQSVPVAEWRQEDPGSYPAGDVYGGGSPTGNVYYENGALGKAFEGMFLACEPGRNVVFGYRPELEGAGFKLERFDFVTSNPAGEHDNGREAAKRFAGSDFLGGSDSVTGEIKTLFRPSDVAVSPDGAIYVCDWYDPRVGGHQDLDETCSGAIYRIAPKGFKPEVPSFDLNTIEGAITALSSPAVNVRELGRAALVEGGAESIPALEELLQHENPYLAIRAVWVLAKLGDEGAGKVWELVKKAKYPQVRIAAVRALRREWDANGDEDAKLTATAFLNESDHPAVRREAALALRNVEFDRCDQILLQIAREYDGKDRAYLEALGTACSKKESQAYALFKSELGADDPKEWSDAFADLAWRLHVPEAIADLKARATATDLDFAARKQALDALAFTMDPEASDAVVEIALLGAEDPLNGDAKWWLLNRANNEWRDYGLMAKLKETGIYDPAKVVLVDNMVPKPDDSANQYPPMEELLAMTGDATRGKTVAARCIVCHQIGGQGVIYGPGLDGWGRTQTREVIFRSLIDPSADIAHGYDGTEILTKDGKTIHGLIISQGNPRLIKSMGGMTQTVPAGRIKAERKLKRSLMLSAAQQALTAQDVADLVAYLKEN